ncbi:putative insulin-degrading enzyme [Gregarina niphandrodes]|uniref:Insulin-degrading enzyme n=1 Tax=Gregarina niphandrodes TaxID=110365 RepID=A0A023AY14_GRENI|nr:putative insulin-degrading enzyme [Gregarina niphandrodes]EZG43537.1 putative insulin-degrading enzyme [Gregarina niphandrodes]|eukprot:XP_011133222.1 putative insulin-degrading enzyme [Gregarina niphandrodes]
MAMLGKESIKSPIAFDDYDYGVATLSNGLRVLLVSSADRVDKAACAIGVGVGQMSDPRELEGLAHFCEHMLFMGTAKYPDEQEYQEYVQKNGGMTNAFTTDTSTVYYATVKPDALDGLVDRTSEFFVSPAFNQDAVDREVEAVNSEHEKDLQNDTRRKYQLLKHLCNQEHPFTKFSTGNNRTLRRLEFYKNDNAKALSALRQSLVQFHSEHYSANNMAAVILGREPLQILKEMAEKYMSRIPNHDYPIIRGSAVGKPHLIFSKEYVNRLVDVLPVKEGDRKLEFIFAMPDQRDHYKSKPASFISHILGHEGEGSILDILKSKHICTALFAGCLTENTGQSVFEVSLDMASDEVFSDENIIYIGKLIFGVLRRLKYEASRNPIGFTELIKDEQKVNYIRWKYRPMFDVHELVKEGVSNLLACEPKEVLEAAYINTEVNPGLINNHIDLLLDQAKDAIVWRTGMKFGVRCNEEERIYKTKYHVEALPEEWSREWNGIAKSTKDDDVDIWLKNEGIKQVEKNKFVPESFELKAPTTDIAALPVYINPTGGSAFSANDPIQIWFKQETSFRLPQFLFSGRIHLPLFKPTLADLLWMKENDVTRAKVKQEWEKKDNFRDLIWPARVALYLVYQKAVMESVNDKLYDARLAGVIYNTAIISGTGQGSSGLQFEVGGFDDKGEKVMETFINSFTEFNANETHLKTVLAELVRSFTNKTKATDPYVHVLTKASDSMSYITWDDRDMLESLSVITVDVALKYLRKGKKLNPELFDGATVLGAIVGNVTDDEVRKCYANPNAWSKLIQNPGKYDLNGKERLLYDEIDFDKLRKEDTMKQLQRGTMVHREIDDSKGATKGADDSNSAIDVIVIKTPTLNSANPNGAVVLTIQAFDSEYQTYAFNNVMSIWLSDLFFDDLRTKQTLGYVVGMPNREVGRRLMRCLLAQSTRSTEYVLSRMLNFIQEKCLECNGNTSFSIKPAGLSEESFTQCTQAVISQLREKPKELYTVYERMSNEILTLRNDFSRREKQIKFLESYKFAQFKQDLVRALTHGKWIALLAFTENTETSEIQLDNLTPYQWCNIYSVKHVKDIIYSTV